MANATSNALAEPELRFLTEAVTVIESNDVGCSGECDTVSPTRSAAESTATKAPPLRNEPIEPPIPPWLAYSGDGKINRAANAPTRRSTPLIAPGGSTASVHTSPNGSAARGVNSMAAGSLGSGGASTGRQRMGCSGGGSGW